MFKIAREALRRFALFVGLVPLICGASHRTKNFVVEAPSAEIARQVADRAERCRGANRPRLARPRVAPLEISLPDPRENHRERGRRLTSFTFSAAASSTRS